MHKNPYVFMLVSFSLDLLGTIWQLTTGVFKWLVTWAYQPIAEYWVDTMVGVCEESAKSFVRECFQAFVGVVNGMCAGVAAWWEGGVSEIRNNVSGELSGFEKRRPSNLNNLVVEENQVGESEEEEDTDAIDSCAVDSTDAQNQDTAMKSSKSKAVEDRSICQSSGGPTGAPARGWVEDIHIYCEMAITWFFCKVSRDSGDAGITSQNSLNIKPMPSGNQDDKCTVHSSVDKLMSYAGYPLEDHDVLTDDGYILTLHRLPRPNSCNVVFFQHGVLDTSISWCSNGVPRSLAFRAYDAGYDVWLGNCRANPPHRHTNPKLPSHKYWHYSLNELGLNDVGAQLERIHVVKSHELKSCKVTEGCYIGHDPQREVKFHSVGNKYCDSILSMNNSSSVNNSTVDLDSNSHSTGPGNSCKKEPGSKFDEKYINRMEGLPVEVHHLDGALGAGTSEVAADTIVDENVGGNHTVDGERGVDMENKPGVGSTYKVESKPDVCMGGRLNNKSGIELGSREESHSEDPSNSPDEPVPYHLRAVGHSLGGAALLIHLVMSLRGRKPHRLQRLVLLSPAGFHLKLPALIYPFLWLVPAVKFLWTRVLKREGMGIMIPGRYLRMAIFKGLRDVVRFPGVRRAVNLLLHSLLGGDRSPWDNAMQLPHYSADGMPGVSLDCILHLLQLSRSKKFQMFDYKDPEVHQRRYNDPAALDIASQYKNIDIPVNVIAGKNDGVVPPSCVKMHYEAMKRQGINVTYEEFDYGHLEFSYTTQDDLASYVIKCLGGDCVKETETDQ